MAQYDGDGNETQFAYNDGGGTYALPISATNALNQTTQASYDYNILQPVSTTDINGNGTSYSYNDALDRLTNVTLPTNAKTTYSYPSTTERDVYQDQASSGDQALHTRQLFDGLGRLTETDGYESSSGYIATTQSYDAMGRVATSTNPSRAGDGLNYATSYAYDSLNRITKVTTADGSTATTSYSGNQTTVTDAMGHARQSTQDGLGRMTQVVEDPGSSPHLAYTTNYTFDGAGDLTSVTQGAQTRTFTFDGLQRMTQAVNPESGTVTYTFDNASNLKTRKDNRGTTTTYGFDALNRVNSVSYSDSTPAVSYAYDPAVTNGKGQLGSVTAGNSVTAFTQFDAIGEVLASSQTTAGETYNFAYAYSLAGGLTAETYPSGRTVAVGYDGANRPFSLSGNYSGNGKNYVQSAVYWPHGAVNGLAYGNSVTPLWHYNSRLQLDTIYATNNNSSNNFLLQQLYSYGTTNNNGKLQSGSEGYGNSVPSGSLTWLNQTYGYDNVNRVTSVSDSGYSRTFGYDSYGNMWVTGNSGVPLAGNTPTSNVFNAATNQIGGGSYDAAGNQLAVNGNTLAYDAENRPSSVTEPASAGGGTVQYFYDGTGRRVEKLLNGNLTVFVYDALGQLAAEYDSGNTPTPVCQTFYLVQDVVGSTRLVTDDIGRVAARHDFLPFGEEVAGGTGGRSNDWGITDYVDQKFTSQVRDEESGLDYFNARYYGSALGRFLSADPANAGASMGDPQSWNGYGYVRGSPLDLVDPSGMTSCTFQNNFCGLPGLGNFSNEFDLLNIEYSQVIASLSQQSADINYSGGGSESVTFDPSAGYFNMSLLYQSGSETFISSEQTSTGHLSCNQPPAAPAPRHGANVNANIDKALKMSQGNFLVHVWPNGDRDYAHKNGQQYVGFGNFSYGATCSTFFSLSTCQRGAGAAAFMTATKNVVLGGRWTAGPGNPFSPVTVNGQPDYGDQVIASENPSIIAGYSYGVWYQACRK